jgi:hypothetical protein
MLTFPEYGPSFFVSNIDAREATRFPRHQVIVFFALFAIGDLQTRAVGDGAQDGVTGIGQRIAGKLIAKISLTRCDHLNCANTGRSGGHRTAQGIA